MISNGEHRSHAAISESSLRRAVRRVVQGDARMVRVASACCASIAMLASNALSASPFPAEFELSSLLSANGGDGTDGFVLNAAHAHDQTGYSVSGAGDVNGDGIDDFIVGAPYFHLYEPDSSAHSFVVFGVEGGFPA